MADSTISIPLDAQTAKVYENASVEQRRKMQVLVRLWLRELASSELPSLQEVLDRAGQKAKARGLDPESLEALLNGE